MAIVLVAGCGGSDDPEPEARAANPTMDAGHVEECLQFATDWVVAADEQRATVLMARERDISRTRQTLERQARQLASHGCEQVFVEEIETANEAFIDVQVAVATCLEKHGPAVQAGTEYCNAAGDLWEASVLPHIVRATDLIAKERDPNAVPLTLSEVCTQLGPLLPVGLEKLDRQKQIVVLGDITNLHRLADAQTQHDLGALVRVVSWMATGFDPEEKPAMYVRELAEAQELCAEAGAVLKPSRQVA